MKLQFSRHCTPSNNPWEMGNMRKTLRNGKLMTWALCLSQFPEHGPRREHLGRPQCNPWIAEMYLKSQGDQSRYKSQDRVPDGGGLHRKDIQRLKNTPQVVGWVGLNTHVWGKNGHQGRNRLEGLQGTVPCTHTGLRTMPVPTRQTGRCIIHGVLSRVLRN